ncbi:MAG: hypothetical protein KatS3mg105_5029 [Gemmatales bacterium]|nr:MAG: hypothetical protein KatS3mg105_5029 [Gemmatales bacterium]
MHSPTLYWYATGQDSMYPELWQDCIDRICPALGATGLRLINFATPSRWGRFTTLRGLATDGEASDYNTRAIPELQWVVQDGILGYRMLTDRDRVCYVGHNSYHQWHSTLQISVSTWVFPTATQRQWFYAFCHTDWTERVGLYSDPLNYTAWGGDLCFYRFNSVYVKVGSDNNTFTLNRWHHVAVTLSGNRLRMYLNGNLVGQHNSFGNPSPNAIFYTHGIWVNTFDPPSNRDSCISPIAETSVFLRVLRDDEIRLLAQHPTIAFIPRRKRYVLLDAGMSELIATLQGITSVPTFAHQGERWLDGLVNPSLPGPNITHQGERLLDGLVNPLLPSPSITNQGERLLDGSLAASIASISGSHQGERLLDGSVNPSLPGPDITNQGERVLDGSVDLQTPSLVVNALAQNGDITSSPIKVLVPRQETRLTVPHHKTRFVIP